METKIDQDGFLSGQLSHWNQQGSRVIRGNTLVIPIDNSLLYVEPIFLQAEAAAYPELRLVAVMHGDNLSYAETFDEALLRAKQAFDDYLRLQGEGRFVEAAKALARLREILQQLAKQVLRGAAS